MKESKESKESQVEYTPQDFEVDTTEALSLVETEKPTEQKPTRVTSKKPVKEHDEVVNCLTNKRVIIRHIPKQTGLVSNPKHILYGGMAENAKRTFVVPKLASGVYVNILTNSEKAYLEEVMGLEYNALSVHKRPESENYWNDANENSVSRVTLSKQDNYLDLSDPEDYIRYKILLANKDYIAPSMQDLEDNPKETYQFVIIAEGEETKMAKNNMSYTMQCYKEFGKVEEDKDILMTLIELIDGRPISPHSKLEFIQTKANALIQADSKLFLKVITDPLLSTKVLIKKAIRAGLISNRGNGLYLKSDGSPLCEFNEEPTLNIAAKYLSSPQHQEIKFGIEAKIK